MVTSPVKIGPLLTGFVGGDDGGTTLIRALKGPHNFVRSSSDR